MAEKNGGHGPPYAADEKLLNAGRFRISLVSLVRQGEFFKPPIGEWGLWIWRGCEDIMN